MSVRKKVRESRREAYRDSIVDAARSLFEQQGFRAITMADIAKAAGVAKGTLYNYFDSKEEVFAELSERGRQEFLDTLDAVIVEFEGWERLHVTVRHTLEFLATNTPMLSVYLEATTGARDSAADPHQSWGEQAFYGRLADSLNDLDNAGKLRADLPVDFLVIGLSGLIDATVRFWMTSTQPRDATCRAEQITRLFRQGSEA